MTRDLTNKRTGVLGLAKSGVAAARLLAAKGARVQGIDKRTAGELGETARELQALGVSLVTQPEAKLSELDVLVVSPGVPHLHPAPHPVVAQARAAGVPITNDIELFFEVVGPRPIVGVTGTN
ncbi:MAG: UDP-N-acetylmuramoyl-L-alanine--D-glutamate ligase, partial [Myxococcales bacterium]